MNNIPYFRYITGDSKVHKMNSKMKMLWFLLSIFDILLMRDNISLLLFLLLIFFVIFNTKINLYYYFKNIFIIFPAYVLLFIIVYILCLNLSLSLFITIKFICIIILFIVITFTTSLSEIAWGFECLFEKLKKVNIPVTKIALRLAFSIKFLGMFSEQIKTIGKSMAYRGVPYKKGIISSFTKMIIPSARLSYNLSKRTIVAMKLRFYGYGTKRTNYHENKKTNFDTALIAFNLIFIYVILWLGWLR